MKYLITDFNEVPINTIIPSDCVPKLAFKKTPVPASQNSEAGWRSDGVGPSWLTFLTTGLNSVCVCVWVSVRHTHSEFLLRSVSLNTHPRSATPISTFTGSHTPPSSPVSPQTHTHTQREGWRTSPSVPLGSGYQGVVGCLGLYFSSLSPSLSLSLLFHTAGCQNIYDI